MKLEVKITYTFGEEEGAVILERAVDGIFQSVGNVLFFDLGCDYKEVFILWIIYSAVHLILLYLHYECHTFYLFFLNFILFLNFT